MTVRANKPAFNIREKLKELTQSIGLKGRELMRAATVQEARDLVSAGRRNLIINGDMNISQRISSTETTIVNDLYSTDRYRHQKGNNSAVTTVQQTTDAPPGFTKSLKITVTTADSSVATDQYHYVRQIVEGNNMIGLGWGTSNAKPVTLSFWTRSSVTGTHGGSLFNDGFDRSFPFEYTINSADTWEHKSITIPGCTDGTWLYDAGRGISVEFSQGVGTDYTGTPNQWNSAGDLAPTNHVNLIATLNATWYITGLQLEVGKNATEFEHRSYGEELALCQRYYHRIYNGTQRNNTRFAIGSAVSSGDLDFIFDLPVTMRSVPTIDRQAVGNYRTPSGPSGPITSFTNLDMAHATESVVCVRATKSGAFTTGTSYILSPTGSGADNDRYIGFSAEL